MQVVTNAVTKAVAKVLGVDRGNGAAALVVAGSLKLVAMEQSRPADTDAYAAKDVVADLTSAPTPWAFEDVVSVSAGSGYITAARLVTNQSGCTARFRLHLFTDAGINALAMPNDNEPFALRWSERAGYLGYIDFPALSTEGAGSDAAQSVNAEMRLPFVCSAGSTSVNGVLETLDAFTPVSTQGFRIELTVDQN